MLELINTPPLSRLVLIIGAIWAQSLLVADFIKHIYLPRAVWSLAFLQHTWNHTSFQISLPVLSIWVLYAFVKLLSFQKFPDAHKLLGWLGALQSMWASTLFVWFLHAVPARGQANNAQNYLKKMGTSAVQPDSAGSTCGPQHRSTMLPQWELLQ